MKASRLAASLPATLVFALHPGEADVPGNNQFANLKRAGRRGLGNGRLEEDDPASGCYHPNGRRRAGASTGSDRQSGKLRPGDTVIRQFFVYRRESLIYRGAAWTSEYASTELYDVVLAGPPIPGLSFELE